MRRQEILEKGILESLWFCFLCCPLNIYVKIIFQNCIHFNFLTKSARLSAVRCMLIKQLYELDCQHFLKVMYPNNKIYQRKCELLYMHLKKNTGLNTGSIIALITSTQRPRWKIGADTHQKKSILKSPPLPNCHCGSRRVFPFSPTRTDPLRSIWVRDYEDPRAQGILLISCNSNYLAEEVYSTTLHRHSSWHPSRS